jgi:flavin reductase (DIM6/NTAB) family NADH-FMN oxidoreductase RutF
MFYDSEARRNGASARALPFNPFKALVAPRPIGWISTLTEDGLVNLAPYSYFQAIADNPDIVMFSATPELSRRAGEQTLSFGDQRKHSETNAATSGEFVCNVVSFEQAASMNATSAHLPAEISEAEHAGIAMAPSEKVLTPRVAACPAALECVFLEARPVPKRGGPHCYQMVFGEVVGIHIDDRYVNAGRVDTAAMRVLTRLGYDEYAVLEKTFAMSRPDNDPILDGALKS